MFRNSHQTGFLSILYSVGACPLAIWDQKVKNGHIRRVTDEDVKSLAIEVSGTNVATTYIVCPSDPKQALGIRLPFFVMIVKNMKKYFSFEIQIMDDKNQPRRFRVSNYQSTTRVRPFCTTMPIGLSPGWNQIQFNLADFTRRAYGSTYLETLRVQIHANVRIRRIYFSDRLYSEDEMPKEYKLYLPVGDGAPKKGKKEKGKPTGKESSEPKLKEIGTDVKSKEHVKEEEIPSGAPPSPSGHQETEAAKPEGHPEEAAPAPPEEGSTVPPTEGVEAGEGTEVGTTEPLTEVTEQSEATEELKAEDIGGASEASPSEPLPPSEAGEGAPSEAAPETSEPLAPEEQVPGE